MHQSPLIELVILQFDLAVLDGHQDVLCPGNQQEHNGPLLFGNSPNNPFGFYALQKNAFGAHDEVSEPVHFGAGVIERGDADEIVFVGLVVMPVLHDASVLEVPVSKEDGLGLSCRA